MPWEVTILKPEQYPPKHAGETNASLGTCDEVREFITDALPGIRWFLEPSLIESSRQLGMSIPDSWDEETLQKASLAQWRGQFDSDDLFIEMYGLPDGAEVSNVHLEIRGTGDPLPHLRRMCAARSWTVREAGKDGKYLDLDGNAAQQWRAFRDYVDHVVNQVRPN